VPNLGEVLWSSEQVCEILKAEALPGLELKLLDRPGSIESLYRLSYRGKHKEKVNEGPCYEHRFEEGNSATNVQSGNS
jgi:hypothetical protein